MSTITGESYQVCPNTRREHRAWYPGAEEKCRQPSWEVTAIIKSSWNLPWWLADVYVWSFLMSIFNSVYFESLKLTCFVWFLCEKMSNWRRRAVFLLFHTFLRQFWEYFPSFPDESTTAAARSYPLKPVRTDAASYSLQPSREGDFQEELVFPLKTWRKIKGKGNTQQNKTIQNKTKQNAK